MQPEVSLLCSQNSATGPCFELAKCISHPHALFIQDPLGIISHINIPCKLFFQGYWSNLVKLSRPPLHVTQFILLDLITLIFGEGNKYSSQQPVLIHPRSTFYPSDESLRF